MEISSRIWEGDDYVPFVLDQWMNDPSSDLWVLEFEGKIISFSRYVRFFPDYVWFEGLRTDPEFQGRGAAKALTSHMVEMALKEGASRIGLSIYSENTPSLKVAESAGFLRKASFIFFEGTFDTLPTIPPKYEIMPLCPFETYDFLLSSKFLSVSNGYLPLGWKFVPLELGKEFALSKIKVALGIKREGKLSSLLLSSEFSQPYGNFSLDFIEGEREEILTLLSFLKGKFGERKSVEGFIPKVGEMEAPALSLLKELNFKTWNDFREDVFVLEREIP